jgi:chromosome segregation ATPase
MGSRGLGRAGRLEERLRTARGSHEEARAALEELEGALRDAEESAKAARDLLEERKRDAETAEQLAGQFARLGTNLASDLASLEEADAGASLAAAKAKEAEANWDGARAALADAGGRTRQPLPTGTVLGTLARSVTGSCLWDGNRWLTPA